MKTFISILLVISSFVIPLITNAETFFDRENNVYGLSLNEISKDTQSILKTADKMASAGSMLANELTWYIQVKQIVKVKDIEMVQKILSSNLKPTNIRDEIFEEFIYIDRNYSGTNRQYQLETKLNSEFEKMNFSEIKLFLNNMEYEFRPFFKAQLITNAYLRLYNERLMQLPVKEAAEIISMLGISPFGGGAKTNKMLEQYFENKIATLTKNELEIIISELKVTRFAIFPAEGEGFTGPVQNLTPNSPKKVEARIRKRFAEINTGG